MSLSPRSAMKTGSTLTYKAACYERHLSTYMEQMEYEYRWATSKVTRMIGDINRMRGQVYDLTAEYLNMRERAKTMEVERKLLLAEDRARRTNDTEEVKYLDNLIDHLNEIGSKIQLKPCIVTQDTILISSKQNTSENV
ncbi:hypothetical protein LOTGIDRAFT_238617 [Lottia gigantea]|uniref:Uncharacterized protein n=1 Tax=Lottia gigantea TaxID=225164 RepID=V4AYP5_LOTGI|nr:hypothetical protein LOTGIDRAFT_238617 [Lottia gigantea]ESP00281.1 hypothetical protein LOTGIDRAFT_238617 [Lottia gigantea]